MGLDKGKATGMSRVEDGYKCGSLYAGLPVPHTSRRSYSDQLSIALIKVIKYSQSAVNLHDL